MFPPNVPLGLVAVAAAGENGAGPAIDLSWQPNTDSDLGGVWGMSFIVVKAMVGGSGSHLQRRRGAGVS